LRSSVIYIIYLLNNNRTQLFSSRIFNFNNNNHNNTDSADNIQMTMKSVWDYSFVLYLYIIITWVEDILKQNCFSRCSIIIIYCPVPEYYVFRSECVCVCGWHPVYTQRKYLTWMFCRHYTDTMEMNTVVMA